MRLFSKDSVHLAIIWNQMKYFIYILLIMVFCSVNTVNAQHLNEYFKDSTLRIDYVFSGNRHMQMVAVDKLYVMPVLYGK